MVTTDSSSESQSQINWTIPRFQPSSFRAMLDSPWSFEETVARLITLSRQNPTKSTDQYKVSVEFQGTYRGALFTLLRLQRRSKASHRWNRSSKRCRLSRKLSLMRSARSNRRLTKWPNITISKKDIGGVFMKNVTSSDPLLREMIAWLLGALLAALGMILASVAS
jgi:hypothetical protein